MREIETRKRKRKCRNDKQEQSRKNNPLLTKRDGRTGKYWPEVVAVRTERSEVRTKTTEGEYALLTTRTFRMSGYWTSSFCAEVEVHNEANLQSS